MMNNFKSYYVAVIGEVFKVIFVRMNEDGRHVYKERHGARVFYLKNSNFVFDNRREAMIFALGIYSEIKYLDQNGKLQSGEIGSFISAVKDNKQYLLVAIIADEGSLQDIMQEPKAIVGSKDIRLDDYEARWIEQNQDVKLHHYHSDFCSHENGLPTPVAMFMRFNPLLHQRLSRRKFRFKKSKGARKFLMSMN